MVDKATFLLKLAARITELRKAKGLSMHGLANEAGIEYALVQRIEKAKVDIQFSTLIAISRGLEIESDELLRGIKFHS